MPKSMIEFIETDEEEEQEDRKSTIRGTKISFSKKLYSFRASDQRETNLTKEVKQTAVIKQGEKVQESKISRRMVYLTNKRLMMVLILTLVLLPMFSVFFWSDYSISYSTNMDFLAVYYRQDIGEGDKFLREQLAPAYENRRQ